ncbi:T9SS type A sorting domain-containing protein [Natronoflexus pectinivorans]|uniref:Putative secreted protein (Por secretion system target) n=1 Tax=Natronoflexus pectinivorans TaxID=682526 RepID=A0A4R2GDA9_9BACT|nr:T9SS type A sorting domain-containing protein [Natronoflexus pectinivorans]TCO06078.1 putative secreted protein (Por secretion system target) [Natronoflexus pectinivorans]
MKRAVCVGVFVLMVALVNATSFFVAENGTADGIGTMAHPWDLQTALDHPEDVQPGDTIWIKGGLYSGVFTSYLRGREGTPIILRAVPGERVVIDGNSDGDELGVLNIMGQHAWYWGLTITNSDETGENYYRDGVYFIGHSNKVINCYIHNNGGNGVGFWRPATSSEIYGTIIYHNGFRGSRRGHGHGIYGQNQTGTKLIRDNVLFNSFGIGIQIYTEEGAIEGFVLEGNIIFNSGIPGNRAIDRNILVGGLQPADRISIRNNIIYNRPQYSSKASVQLGYGVENRNAEFSDNIIVDGTLHVIKGWNSLQIVRNRFFARNPETPLIAFDDFSLINNPVINNNQYFAGTLNFESFSEWQDKSNQDQTSTFQSRVPAISAYEISANRYEKGRGQIAVFNWGNQEFVSVNLSRVLSINQEFQIFDVQNLSGNPVLSGVYNGGTIQLPMRLSDIERPFLEDSFKDELVHTLPEFGVFLVLPVKDSHTTGPEVSEVLPMKIRKCYPNPTVDILAVDFYAPSRDILKAEVFDEAGRLMHHEEYRATFGDNTLILNLASLSGGVYIISLSGKSGQKSECKVLKRDFVLNMNSGGGVKVDDESDQDRENFD